MLSTPVFSLISDPPVWGQVGASKRERAEDKKIKIQQSISKNPIRRPSDLRLGVCTRINKMRNKKQNEIWPTRREEPERCTYRYSDHVGTKTGTLAFGSGCSLYSRIIWTTFKPSRSLPGPCALVLLFFPLHSVPPLPLDPLVSWSPFSSITINKLSECPTVSINTIHEEHFSLRSTE